MRDETDLGEVVQAALGKIRSADGSGPLRFEIHAEASGQYRWRLRTTNATTIAVSGDAFASRDAAGSATADLRARGGLIVVISTAGKWIWHLASEGRLVATGASTFSTKDAAQINAQRVLDLVGDAIPD